MVSVLGKTELWFNSGCKMYVNCNITINYRHHYYIYFQGARLHALKSLTPLNIEDQSFPLSQVKATEEESNLKLVAYSYALE